MGNVIWLLLLFVAAVVAALTFGRNDGLVSFFWAGWRADLSLNLFLILLLLLCLTLMVTVKGVVSLVSLPRRAAAWRAQRREQAAHGALREAQAEYFSARFGRAYKAAQRACALGEEGFGDREALVLAHLIAAGSLHRLQDSGRRDAQLERLFGVLARKGGNRRADDGARLLAAEWALDDGRAGKAVEWLSELPPGVARRTHALRLRLRAARQLGQTVEALHMARLLANHQAFSPVVARGLLRTLAAEAMDGAHDVDQMGRVWRQLEESDRRDPAVAARAAQRVAELGAPALARQWLRPHWEKLGSMVAQERERVALALIAAAQGIEADWLVQLEAAARTHPQDPAVLLAVGFCFAERQLWGKARLLLERGAEATTLPAALRRRAWLRLADLARTESDEDTAHRCERAAAAIDA